MAHKISLFTDGACSPNPGLGGWAAILVADDRPLEDPLREKVLSGSERCTTNNRMEILAVIMGLSVLKTRCEVTVFTDSLYVANAFLKNWVAGWKRKAWKEVKNADLWQQLIALVDHHSVQWSWVRGHNDHPENERCDKLAVEARLSCVES